MNKENRQTLTIKRKRYIPLIVMLTLAAQPLAACGPIVRHETAGPSAHVTPAATSVFPAESTGAIYSATPSPSASVAPTVTVVPVAKASLLTGPLPVLQKWPPLKVESFPPVERKPGQKVAYLTFDDGPAPVGIKPTSGTPNLLAILERYHVRATFFMIGKNVYDNPELARRVVADGNIVGNHTWSHISFHDVKGKAFRLEVDFTNEVIQDVTGVDTKLIRPPGGNMPDKTQLSFLRKEHKRLFIWNVDTRDWAGNSDSEILALVQQGIDARKDLVILSHDYAFGAVDRMIELLQRNGYLFDTLDHFEDSQSSLVEQ